MNTFPFLFRQLFDPESSTYTYLIGDPESRQMLIIDPVLDRVDRDLQLIDQLGYTLTHIFDTHIHADHITGSGRLRQETGAQICMGSGAVAAHPDLLLSDGDRVSVGAIEIEALSTPGHTDGCTTYRVEDRLFTGDVLLIRGTGRTDFQQGSPEKEYASIQRLYQYSDETLIYPGHDYTGMTVSTIGEEKQYNPRIRVETTEGEFVDLMNSYHFDKPKKIDIALPANLRLGLSE